MKKFLLLVTAVAACGMFNTAQAQLSKNPDKFLGNITTRYQVDTDGFEYWTLWNQITPENESKWGSVEGTKGSFNWNGADNCANYAKKHNFPFKFHAIIWGAQHPNWFNSSLSIYERKTAIYTWMSEMKKHYKTIDLIDVANECVSGHQADTWLFQDPLGGTGMSGWDWLVNAFKKAHELWPEAILIYNDFNTFQWNTDQFIDLVTKLRDAGAPIDAYGCQSHDLTDCNISNFKNSMTKLQNALKMPMFISEYDLGTDDDNHQKKQMADQFPVMWEADYCAGVTLWGWIYGATWTTNGNSGLVRNGKDRPAMTWLKEYMATEAAAQAKSPYPGMKKPISFYIQPEKYKSPIDEPCLINIEATTHNGTSVEKVEFFINNELAATLTDAPFVYEYTPKNENKVNFKAIAYTSDGKTYERLGAMYGSKYPQCPFSGEPIELPGIIEAEDFDMGGEGISYHDSDNDNSGSADYRTDGGGVDIYTTSDDGYAIDKTEAGEWLEYTVNMTATGKQKFETIAGSMDKEGSKVSMLIYKDGDLKKQSTFEIPYTGRKKYTSVTGDTGYRWSTGEYKIRLYFHGAKAFIDKIIIGDVTPIEEVQIAAATYMIFNVSGSYVGEIKAADRAEIAAKIVELTGNPALYIVKNTVSGETFKIMTK